MTNEDDEMIELNQKVYEEAGEHNERIKDSMLVATTYIAVGSRILRSLLDETNYKKFMDHIAEEDIKPLEKPVLH
tara:strand:- start:214 stop:438 length:225 start_codon:yes stop_codon:yes gene_type:complete